MKIYAQNLHRYELSVNCRESHNTSKQQVDGNLVDLELPNRLWRNRDLSMKAAAMVLALKVHTYNISSVHNFIFTFKICISFWN